MAGKSTPTPKQTPKQTRGARVPSRPATASAAQQDARSPQNGDAPVMPVMQPNPEGPAPQPAGRKPRSTAPLPEETRSRSYEERNA